LQGRVERKSAKDKVQIVQEALNSFKNLFDAGLIDAQEHEKRRAQLLDKLTDVDEVSAPDSARCRCVCRRRVRATMIRLILPEELRLGGTDALAHHSAQEPRQVSVWQAVCESADRCAGQVA
jgi:hypothetical protein